MRYFFRAEFDGTDYCGWQKQPNCRSVQTEIEKALSILLRTPIEVIGAGRTDAGVHARGMGVHFDTPNKLNIHSVLHSLNGLLPYDISVYEMHLVTDTFHARFSALVREYSYTMVLRKTPLSKLRAWEIRSIVDWDLVTQNARDICGTHDFSTFCCADTATINKTCTVFKADIARSDSNIVFSIAADRFIYRMVRSLTGTLIDIGRGKIKASMKDLIASCDRLCAGTTAPAAGLVLETVEYPKDSL